MNRIIDEIYHTGVVRDQNNNEYPLHSSIDRVEGDLIYQLIRSESEINRTLEIGCAYGLSSLFICAAIYDRENRKHTIIDPFQHSHWHGIGVLNLNRAGYDFFELQEIPSEFSLPSLASDPSKTYDLIFIDGMHTLDHTIVDIFYANLLLRIGGYIILDDCTLPPVAKAVNYLSKYPAYHLVMQSPPRKSIARAVLRILLKALPPSIASFILPKYFYEKLYIRGIYSSMVAFRKVGDDQRDWNWYAPF
jgi:predicted O-methyltransferase YrrM